MSNYAANIHAAWTGEMKKVKGTGRMRPARYRKIRKLALLFIRAGSVRAAFGPI